MNILLALLLYKNLSMGDILNLRPFLPIHTQRGLSALEAYHNADCTADHVDTAELADRLANKGFPFVLLRLLLMKEHSQDDIFKLLKHILPAEVANNIPDPKTIMNMINIISAMNFSSGDSDCDQDYDRDHNKDCDSVQSYDDTHNDCNCHHGEPNRNDNFCSNDTPSYDSSEKEHKKSESRTFDERQISFFKKFIKD